MTAILLDWRQTIVHLESSDHRLNHIIEPKTTWVWITRFVKSFQIVIPFANFHFKIMIYFGYQLLLLNKVVVFKVV